jgi:serine O-acetyltransferase
MMQRRRDSECLPVRLLRLQRFRILRKLCREVLYLYGCDLPYGVQIGHRVQISHRGLGVVIHPRTTIEDDVTIFHGVTIGRAAANKPMGPILVGRGAIIGAGAVVLSGESGRVIGNGARIGANSVVTCDVPPHETWVGIPARPASKSIPL